MSRPSGPKDGGATTAVKGQERVQLSLRATNIKKAGMMGQGVINPFAHVTMLGVDATSTHGEDMGRTETIPSAPDPDWCKVFLLDFKFGKPMNLKVEIFNDKTYKHKSLGSVVIEVGEILGARGNTVTKSLGEEGGTLVARVEKAVPYCGTATFTFQGQNLRNMELRGQSDPFFVLARKDSPDGSQWETVYRSAFVENNLSPMWESFTIPIDRLCDGDYDQMIRFSVHDFEGSGKHRRMGQFDASLNDMLAAKIGGNEVKGFTLVKKEKEYGKIFVVEAKLSVDAAGAAEKSAGDGTSKETKTANEPVEEEYLNITLAGIGLKNVEFAGMSDPFFEFFRHAPGANEKGWLSVFRSEHIENNLNPEWEEVSIKLSQLCDNNRDKPIKISVMDFENSGYHKKIGSFETTINELLTQISSDPKDPETGVVIKKRGRKAGNVIVVNANIGVGQPKEDTTPEQLNKSDDARGGSSRTLPPFDANRRVNPSFPRPSFTDYVSAGCELQLCVAVDFHESNGDPKNQSSNHYLNDDGSRNDYERAISEVGDILAKYDSDQNFPVWGYGARFCGKLQNCFQIGPHPEVEGIDGILDSYKDCVGWGFTLGSTAIITGVITQAVEYARKAEREASKDGRRCYTILLILTGGALDFLDGTADCIAEASNAPLSVVVVGIGNADFKDYKYLDDFGKSRGDDARDILNFVEYRDHKHQSHGLSSAIFEEIPDQLVDYFYWRGLPPSGF